MASLKRKQKELEEATAAQSVKINARSTRGKRQGELAGEDAEADQEFWGQDAWNEDDSDYSSEAEEKDVFDSDFNESESSGDEEGGDATEKELRKAERQDKAKEAAAGGGVYKEPVKRKVGRPPGPRKQMLALALAQQKAKAKVPQKVLRYRLLQTQRWRRQQQQQRALWQPAAACALAQRLRQRCLSK
jgi:YL1 nuclear protein